MLQPSSLCYAVPSLKRRFYEAHFVLASFARQATKYMKRLCQAMKRSLFRLHVFLPKFGAKKMVGVISLI